MSHDDCFQVLVVEDDPDAQANLRDILQLDGFEFEIVATGEQALRCCVQMDYAAIVIDWTLPDTTGDVLLPELRRLCPHAALLIVTGTVGLGGTLAAIRHHVVDYLIKPLDSDGLRTSLQRAVERRRLIAEKARSEAAFRSLMEAAPCAVIIFRPDRTIAYFSPQAARLTGYAPDELMGRDFSPFLIRDEISQRRIDEEIQSVLRGGRTRGFDNPIWAKDGGRRWMVWNGERLDDYEGSPAVLAIGLDISARRVAEQRLRAEHATARVLAEAPDLVEAVPQLLHAICESLDWDRGEWWEFDSDSRRLVCRHRWYLAAVGADEFDKISQPVSFAPGDGLPGRVWSTGQPAWLDELQGDAFYIRRQAIDAAGFRSAFAFAAMFHNRPLGVLLFFSRQRQPSEPELLASMASLGSQIGQFVARKRAEQRAVEAERLTAVGQAMEGLIHEGRNALQRSQACLEMLAIEIEGQAEATRLIARVQQAQNEFHRFYECVREYALPLGLNRAIHHLGRVLSDAWEALAERRRERDVSFNQQDGGASLDNWVDREKLVQVFRILLENSLAAAAGPVAIDALWDEVFLEGRPALQLTLKDNGPGIPGAALGKLFQPFNTTKTHGLGLGLATARRIVEAHDGSIVLSNGAAGGAEFVVTLPRARA